MRTPAQGSLKINVDAAFSMLEGHGATGAVEKTGLCQRVQEKRYVAVQNVRTAEACQKPQTDHVITETDSQVFVSLWRSKEENKEKCYSNFKPDF